jgi:acetyl esterase/lipase
MIDRRSFVTGAVLAPSVAQAQQKQDPPFELPDTVEMRKGLEYARYGTRAMNLDLFLPKQRPSKPMPAVVYIHGGGWRNGNPSAFHRQAAHMATLGFAGASIAYRLSGEATWPAAIHDAKSAVRWVRAHASEFGIDTQRIGAAGGSAGGHLAALLGTTAHLRGLEGDGGNAGQSSAVRAVAAFNPAVDLVSFGKTAAAGATGSVAAFLGKPYDAAPQLWELATPITHVNKHSAAFLFLHGDADSTVPIQQSKDMMAKLKTFGVRAEIFTAEGAAHGFFNRPPWYRSTLARMAGFFATALR